MSAALIDAISRRKPAWLPSTKLATTFCKASEPKSKDAFPTMMLVSSLITLGEFGMLPSLEVIVTITWDSQMVAVGVWRPGAMLKMKEGAYETCHCVPVIWLAHANAALASSSRSNRNTNRLSGSRLAPMIVPKAGS
jgi:hypothetical protein